MKLFGSIFGSPEAGALDQLPVEGVYGMTVFVRRFLRALLQYGDFDELHFFIGGLQTELPEGALLRSDPRIRCHRLLEFASAVEQQPFHVLHNLWSPDIGPWTDMRNRLTGRNIPITGLTHTISYQSFLPRVLGTMLLGMRPYDSIICTASTAVEVMRNWVEHLQQGFGGETGIDLRYRGRLDQIPLAVDPEIFRPGDQTELRRRLGLPPDDVLALYVGRFSHYDKMDLFPLVLAFETMVRRVTTPRATLILAGGDSFHEYARRVEAFAGQLGIGDRVTIRKNVTDADMPALYAACDLFVSPSDNLQETFGQSLLEAMASGLPVVCSDWDGYKDLVVHESTGLRVPTYWAEADGLLADHSGLSDWLFDHFYLSQMVSVDVPELSRAIELLVCDSGLRKKWGEAGRRRVHELFSWQVVVRQYLDLWNELSAIAAATPPAKPQLTSWYRPDFVRTFRNYPTAVLGPNARVIASSRQVLPPYPEIAPYLDPRVLSRIRDLAASGMEVGDLEAKVVGECEITPGSFRFHLLWSLKYDQLALNRR
ncbi:MAG TPA: glycosyltransferase family 4 protein [Bryobacteraceae bacterium]|nr:glycosyltransferase family 4 protein [Bryobacteraceae bacterium]